MRNNYKKKKNRNTAIGLTFIFTSLLAYAVYTNIDNDGFDENQVYKINNVAMNINSSDNFSGRLVTEEPTLIMSGDVNKVKKMKEIEFIPEINLDIEDENKEGIYTVTPKVSDKKIGVNYTFKPSKMEIKLIESKIQDFNVVERSYGLAKEGYLVGEMVSLDKAKLKITEEEKLLIGNVIAEIDGSKISNSSTVKAKVLVLDKKGQIMPDIEVKTPEINVDVTLSKMGWLKIQEDIIAIEKELVTLKSELKEKESEIKTVKDVLRKKDLRKEIQFRKTRIKNKTSELEKKKSSIDELKKTQESKKVIDVQKSLENGGTLDKSLIKNKK